MSYKEIYSAPYDFSQSVHDDVRVFLNPEEFAAVHEIDGVKIPCIVSAMKNAPLSPEGVFLRGKVLFARASRLKDPVIGRTARLDGKSYIVLSSSLIQGEIRRIELGRAEG